jgi:hypothetical protein
MPSRGAETAIAPSAWKGFPRRHPAATRPMELILDLH